MYVRVAFEDDDYDAVPATNKSFARCATSANHVESPATAVHDRVAPEPGDIVVRKVRVGAFSTTDLDQQLREAWHHHSDPRRHLAPAGSCSPPSATRADRDYRIFVLADATADFDAEVHDVLMTKIFPRQADVITVAELGEMLPG